MAPKCDLYSTYGVWKTPSIVQEMVSHVKTSTNFNKYSDSGKCLVSRLAAN